MSATKRDGEEAPKNAQKRREREVKIESAAKITGSETRMTQMAWKR